MSNKEQLNEIKADMKRIMGNKARRLRELADRFETLEDMHRLPSLIDDLNSVVVWGSFSDIVMEYGRYTYLEGKMSEANNEK